MIFDGLKLERRCWWAPPRGKNGRFKRGKARKHC